MQHIHPVVSMSFALLCATVVSATAWADEPVRLIGTVVKWRYPDAEIGKSNISDAATIDANGDRTAPSSVLRSTMVTPDSVDKVLAFYRDLLARNPTNDERLGIGASIGRSVVFGDESEGRPFAFHTIVVNSANSSTTLIITRGKEGWNAIRSQKEWAFKTGQPKDPDRPGGAYFTDIEPTEQNLRTLHKRIRVPKVKQEFVFWFVGREGLSQLFGGRGRDRRIFVSPVDYHVPEARQRHGDKTEQLLGEFE